MIASWHPPGCGSSDCEFSTPCALRFARVTRACIIQRSRPAAEEVRSKKHPAYTKSKLVRRARLFFVTGCAPPRDPNSCSRLACALPSPQSRSSFTPCHGSERDSEGGGKRWREERHKYTGKEQFSEKKERERGRERERRRWSAPHLQP